MVKNQTVLKVWTVICHQIFGGWEIQSIWNSQEFLYEEADFSFKKKKNIYKWDTHEFAITKLSQKDSQWNGEAFWVHRSVKRVSCLRHERAHHYWFFLLIFFKFKFFFFFFFFFFFAKGATVNSTGPLFLVGRVFANGPGDWGSIPGRVLPKTRKMVVDASLLSTHHYKVRIKDKVEQSRERCSTLPYTLV